MRYTKHLFSFIRHGIAMILPAILCAVPVSAKKISGTVVDENMAPMEFVNVVLVDSADSTYIAGTVTANDGTFSIPGGGIRLLPVLVKVSFVGYAEELRRVETAGDIGIISMTPNSVMLSEVVVKATLPQTILKGNGIVTNVENSVLSHAGTANDVLAHIPMVIGGDGEFEVFGKGAPLIYINGRIIHDTSELEQLNSEDIKNVEVITTPGARYDASVKSVIRIRTRRPQGDGLSGKFRAQNGSAHYFRTYEQADMKYRTGGLEVFANVGYYGGRSRGIYSTDMTTWGESVWSQFVSETNCETYNEWFGKMGFDYMVNEQHSFGAFYQNGYGKHDTSTDYASDMFSNNNPYDTWNNISHVTSKLVPKHLANVYYNGVIGKLGIDFNMDYMWNKKRASNTSDEFSANYEDSHVTTGSNVRSRLFAEKLVLSYPLWKGGIEIGQEYTDSRLASSFTATGIQLSDVTTQVDENNAAVFVQLSQRFGNMEISAGLRYEHVGFSYAENGLPVREQSRTYDNLFPSLSVSSMLGNVQMALSYSSKTERPGYSLLDGSVNYINRFTYQSGNPYLCPTIFHSVELMGAWRMLFAQISYQHATDPIYNATQPYPGDERVRLITYDNFPRTETLSTFAGANMTFGIWQPKVNVGIIKQWFSTQYNGSEISLNRPMPMVQLQNAIHLPWDVWLNIDAQWRGEGNSQNVLIKSNSCLNAKMYKAFCDNRFSITVEANDIFNKNHEELTFYNGDVLIGAFNRDDTRSVFLTLQYNFNTSRDRYKGRGAGEAEKTRF